MVNEVYEDAQCGILPFSIDRTSLGWFIYAPQGDFPDTNTLLAPLNKAYLAISQHMPCDLAFYVSPVIPLKEINSQAALLLDAKQNNVLRESGIFCPTQHRDKLHMEKFLDTTQLRRWGLLLSQGLYHGAGGGPGLSGHLGGNGGNRPAASCGTSGFNSSRRP